MVEIATRVQRVIGELTGNEALLEMLDTESAAEMLNWGIEMATRLVKSTEGLDETAAEQELKPRLKAIRQTMRSTGHWAAGHYSDPASRIQLRDRLLENLKLISGEEARLPSAEKLDELLKRVEDSNDSPRQLIVGLEQLLMEAR